MYKLRIKLSEFLFRLGKQVHPDIARLIREIKLQQDMLGMAKIVIDENIKR